LQLWDCVREVVGYSPYGAVLRRQLLEGTIVRTLTLHVCDRPKTL